MILFNQGKEEAVSKRAFKYGDQVVNQRLTKEVFSNTQDELGVRRLKNPLVFICGSKEFSENLGKIVTSSIDIEHSCIVEFQ